MKAKCPAHKQKARQRRAFWCICHHGCQAWARSVEEECKLLGCGFSSLLGSVGSSVSSLLGGVSSSVSGGSSSVSSRSCGSSSGSGRSFSSRSGSFHSRSGGSSRSFFLLAASSQSSSSDHGSQNERLLHDNFLLRMSYSVCRTGWPPPGPVGWCYAHARQGHACTDMYRLNACHTRLVYRVCIFFEKNFAFPVKPPRPGAARFFSPPAVAAAHKAECRRGGSNPPR